MYSDIDAARAHHAALRHIALRLVEDFVAEMFCHGESRAQFLRQRILDALELFHSRHHSLETGRRKTSLKSAEQLRAESVRA